MSGSTRTERHLKLVEPVGRADGRECLLLAPGAETQAFADAAAAAGLGLSEAVRLAIERALVLADGRALGFDREGARRELRREASNARSNRLLSPAEADYVRRLAMAPGPGAPRAVAQLDASTALRLPDRLLTRARDTVSENAIDPTALPEMIAWELAATLCGRTMGEWGLRVLGSARAAA